MNCWKTCEHCGGCSLCEDCENGQYYEPAQIEIVNLPEKEIKK